MPHNAQNRERTFRIKHVQKREDIQLKNFLHHLLFFLKCYLGFSGSIQSCELDSVIIAGGKKIQATNKNMKRGENIKSNMCRKRKTKRLKKVWLSF